MLPLCVFASAMDEAQKELADARAQYRSIYESESAELKKLVAQIEKLKTETDALESHLATVKNESAGFDAFPQTIAVKEAKFKTLREDAVKFRDFLIAEMPDDFEIIPIDKVVFAQNIDLLVNIANSKIGTENFFYKVATGNKKNAVGAILKYRAGETQTLEIDPSLGKLMKNRHRTLGERFQAGGIWMYPIFTFGFAALAVALIKAQVSFKAKRAPKNIVQHIIALIHANKENDALALAQKAPYPYKNLLTSFVQKREIEKPLLEEISYEHMLDVGEKLYSGLGFISITAAISPLLGLLGTVTGIIKTFGDLSLYGAGNSQVMSAGISEALITTEFGLIVAIPAIVIHALLTKRAKAVLADMEKISAAFLGGLSK